MPSQAVTRTNYAQIADRAEIDATERQLADMVAILKSEMSLQAAEKFEQRVKNLLALAARVLDIHTTRSRSGPDLTLSDLQYAIELWRKCRG